MRAFRSGTPRAAPGCRAWREWLADPVRAGEGPLPVGLAEHVAACAVCSRELDLCREVSRVLGQDPFPGAHLPSGCAAADWVLRRTSGGARKPRPVRLLLGGALAVTAACVLLLAGELQPRRQKAMSFPARRQAVDAEALPALLVVDDEAEGRVVVLGGAARP